MVFAVIDRYFSLFLIGFEDFNLRLSLIVLLNVHSIYNQGRRQGKSLGGGKGTSGVQGAAPPAGVQGAEPLEAEAVLVLKS